jgi:hypothetical protein
MSDAQERVREAIESQARRFDSVETIAVEPAAEFVRGERDWTRPYIRLIARRPDALRPQLPAEIDSFPVRVVAATMEEQARRYLAFRRASRITPELAASEWRTGFLSAATEAPKNYSRLTYRPFVPTRLKAVAAPMKLIAHVSPDRGWPTLREFLSPAREWHIAMFDFTARHIYDRLRAAIEPEQGTVWLCLGPNESGRESSKPTGITETEIVGGLRDLLEERLRFAWASIGIRRQFPTAYHIKVAVKDRASFWLSSGNWQSTNQPATDFPLMGGAPAMSEAREMAKSNREWHVIVENRELAGILAEYIEKDRRASEMEASEEAPVPVGEPPYPGDDEFVLEFREPLSPLTAEEEAARLPKRVFAPLVLEAAVEVQPILTPDNYAEHALELIGRARRRLWFQNQSLAIGAAIAPKYRELVDALKRKCWEIADSRIIVRDLIRATTLDVLRMLEREGFPMDKVRVMKTCHTKGILVDSRWTLVGSHNWTNEGTLYNRDASLLIDSAEVTRYFEEVLDHDWTCLAESLRVDPGQPSAILPLPGEAVEGARLVVDPRLDRAAD